MLLFTMPAKQYTAGILSLSVITVWSGFHHFSFFLHRTPIDYFLSTLSWATNIANCNGAHCIISFGLWSYSMHVFGPISVVVFYNVGKIRPVLES